MQTVLPLSCFIIAKDEAHRLGAAIRSVKDWVDEVVVVVDDSSTDDTLAVAQAHGVVAVENAWPGYGAQKRFAEERCRNTWLLNIDADEAVTPALAAEIQALFAVGPPAADGYRVFIAEMFAFESKPGRFAHGLWQIRLYDRRKGRFSESSVHDTVRPIAGARIADLKGTLDHRSTTSLSFAVAKLNRYTDAQVADMRAYPRRIGPHRIFSEFPLAFLKAYFLRRYFLRGRWGWVLAVNYAFFRHLRVAKAYEAALMAAAEAQAARRAGSDGPQPEGGRPDSGDARSSSMVERAAAGTITGGRDLAKAAIAGPAVLAVMLDRDVPVATLAVVNDGLKAKGLCLAGAVAFAPPAPRFPVVATGPLLVYFTYNVPAGGDVLEPAHARVLVRLARAFRRRRVRGWLLGRAELDRLAARPEAAAVVAAAKRGVRDLDLGADEAFVADLSQNRVRSSTWLVRRGARLLVRKAYSQCARNQIANELAARRVLADRRVVDIAERRGDVLYLPFVATDAPWRGGLLDFFPRERARQVFDFLGDVARSGHAMIDINPSAFLFDAERGALRVVDLEFFTPTAPAASFAESRDCAGDFGGLAAAPARNGYRRYWYDALGGGLEAVMAASPRRYALMKFSHLLLVRIPRRAAEGLVRRVRGLRDRLVRLAGLRTGCFRI